ATSRRRTSSGSTRTVPRARKAARTPRAWPCPMHRKSEMDEQVRKTLHRDTLAVREAAERSQYGENSEALYLTSGYVQSSAESAARGFAGDEEGFTYGRYGNPTVTSFERRLAALEGSEAAMGTASGMSAILMLCMGLLKAGDHVLASRSMFGSTIKLIG